MLSKSSIVRRALSFATLAALVATVAPIGASAQNTNDLPLRITTSDKSAALQTTHRNRHATSRYLSGSAAAPITDGVAFHQPSPSVGILEL